jgi:hypothetical protein
MLVFLSPPSFAGEAEFPREGDIINPSGRNLVLRAEPPTVSSLSYQLGKAICSVGVGTKFIAYDKVNIVNGEIWYRVSINEKDVRKPQGCPSGKLSGWMVGKLKTGWAVEIKSSVLTTDTSTAKKPPNVNSAQDAFTESEQDEKTEEPNPLIAYVLIGLGTIFGVTILSISKAECVFCKKWITSMYFLECILLLTINIYIYSSLWEHFSQYKEKNALVGLLIIANSGFLGPAILGFVLSAVLLKFTTK